MIQLRICETIEKAKAKLAVDEKESWSADQEGSCPVMTMIPGPDTEREPSVASCLGLGVFLRGFKLCEDQEGEEFPSERSESAAG